MCFFVFGALLTIVFKEQSWPLERPRSNPAENVSKLCAFLCWLSWQTSMSVILVGLCQKIDIDSDGIPHLLALLLCPLLTSIKHIKLSASKLMCVS